MSLRPLKFGIVIVLLDERDGCVVGEVTTDPMTVYGLEGLREFVDRFPAELEKLNDERKEPDATDNGDRDPSRSELSRSPV